VPAKLLKARAVIKDMKVSKDGKNPFAHYDYFSPDQVINLVNMACREVGLVSIFSLEKDELGYFGSLITIDIETGHSWTSVMRTEMPEIKATNAAQQMGGMVTYTKRYMLMNEYDIADNSLDFDAQDNSGKSKSSKQKSLSTAPKFQLKKAAETSEPEPEKKSTLTMARPTEEPEAQEEPSELEDLRSQCDELGIPYTGRHKESGLRKLITEHEKESANVPFEGGEEAEEDPYTGDTEEVQPPTLDDYLSIVSKYEEADELAEKAKGFVLDAQDNGLTDDEVETLKEAINTKYRELRTS
jgi:hypothetical protein